MQYESQNACFSCCGRYRYQLMRCWRSGSGRVLFVGLNPSTADATRDDPTIRRCAGFARDWGFRSFEVVNLFAYRGRSPRELRSTADPVGPDNDLWLLNAHRRANLTIACWGNGGDYLDRAGTVRALCGELYVLRMNLGGQPAHPLYLPAGLRPRIWAHKKGLALRTQS